MKRSKPTIPLPKVINDLSSLPQEELDYSNFNEQAEKPRIQNFWSILQKDNLQGGE